MNVLLDTHAILWTLADDARLCDSARNLVNKSDPGTLAISDMSFLEIALLADRGRITLAGSLRVLIDEVASLFRVLSLNPGLRKKR
ncbi:MAG TPA: hypothetical protein PJ991_03455 [Kiritimatiellia bacterium]|nr:hypothetical protein [Kiritimatiellia bacterium]